MSQIDNPTTAKFSKTIFNFKQFGKECELKILENKALIDLPRKGMKERFFSTNPTEDPSSDHDDRLEISAKKQLKLTSHRRAIARREKKTNGG